MAIRCGCDEDNPHGANELARECGNWLCECGNETGHNGFGFCDPQGAPVEPTDAEWKKPLYICHDCETVYIVNKDGTVIEYDPAADRMDDALLMLAAATKEIATLWCAEGGPERFEPALGGDEYPFPQSFDEVNAAVQLWCATARERIADR